MKHSDAILIGTGQVCPSLAARWAGAGKIVAMIERHQFGSTGVNTGGIPTQTLVASADATDMAARAAKTIPRRLP
jgi:pyruvate/2-oxoglutarate dehydrogenase complex dihydrolipoamide dehydrogenase (E3) component